MVEQLAGLARVLGSDQPDFAQDFQGSPADILEIANRCGDQIECTHFTQGKAQVLIRTASTPVPGL
jgi:hypothetical protein